MIHETRALEWEGTEVDGQVFPVTVEASLIVEAARTLLPDSSAGSEAIPMVLHDMYKQHGLASPANERQVLFKLSGKNKKSLALDFGSNSRKSGGFVSPSMMVGGLSACTGVIGGDAVAHAESGFDPASFFGGAAPKLFGVLSLLDLIDAVGDGPTLLTAGLEAFESLMSDIERVRSLSDIQLPPPADAIQQAVDGITDHAIAAIDHAAARLEHNELGVSDLAWEPAAAPVALQAHSSSGEDWLTQWLGDVSVDDVPARSPRERWRISVYEVELTPTDRDTQGPIDGLPMVTPQTQNEVSYESDTGPGGRVVTLMHRSLP